MSWTVPLWLQRLVARVSGGARHLPTYMPPSWHSGKSLQPWTTGMALPRQSQIHQARLSLSRVLQTVSMVFSMTCGAVLSMALMAMCLYLFLGLLGLSIVKLCQSLLKEPPTKRTWQSSMTWTMNSSCSVVRKLHRTVLTYFARNTQANLTRRS
jgi:hypothetical protein